MVLLPNTWKSFTIDTFNQYYGSIGSIHHSTHHSYSRIDDFFDHKSITTLNTRRHHQKQTTMKPKRMKQIEATSMLIREGMTSNFSCYTSISFYKFVPIKEELLDSLVQSIRTELLCSHNTIKGTLILSKEGFNGQFALPSNDTSLQEFQSALEHVSTSIFNNIDFNIGETINFENQSHLFPYKKLIIRKKDEILTDGIDDPLDWSDAGVELKPQEWHEVLQDNNKNDYCILTSKIVIDCRKKYESDMGMFQGAIPLNTETFSESWEALDNCSKINPKMFQY